MLPNDFTQPAFSSASYETLFSFFLLTNGLVLSLRAQAQAQAGPLVVGISAHLPIRAWAAAAFAPHSSQGSREERDPAPMSTVVYGAETTTLAATSRPMGAAAPAASKSQLLSVLLEPIQVQQARLGALPAGTEAATRRVNRAKAPTVALKQCLRQLEATGSRPSFWH